MTKLSPLMEQYYRVKEQYPDAILLFRVGDFYETFGQDAITISRDLEITLTSRQRDDAGNRIPLAGVPYHALDSYLARLIRAGHKVAICDQVEDPRAARGLVRREVTRVVTPGTIIEPSLLDASSNNFLASVAEQDGMAGLAIVDVSTGEFLTTEIPSDRLAFELARFRPAEYIAASPLEWDGARQQILDEACFSQEGAYAALESHFGPGWAERFRLQERPLSARACGAALSYLHRSHLDALGHLSEIRLYSGSEYMVLDDLTLRNLEILRNMRDRSRRGTLIDLMGATRTPMGARTLSRWLQMPQLSLAEISRRLDAVEELARDAVLRESLAEGLRGVHDLERLISRVSCGAANPKELLMLKEALQRLPAIQRYLEKRKATYLQDLQRLLGPMEDVVEIIGGAMAEDPPANLRDGGVIRDGFDVELDGLRALQRDGRGWISNLEAEERRRTGIKSLKIGYNSVFGYYLEVSRPNLHLVPENYMRKQTLSTAERFVTQELKEMESRVLLAQERSVALEQELFERLRGKVASRVHEIQRRASAIGELDVLLAFATVAVENSFVRPEWNSEGRIALRASRHPVLEKEMRGGFVPNDVLLDQDENRFMILTGPNMAGKSTFMRQIALCVIMAQAGSFVPAEFASLSIVDRIFTRVGAYDDLSSGKSSFMVEMTEIASILRSATKESLVLLDEVGRGTSTFDGLSLAWAISEYLHNLIGCRTIFATHYHQLTQLEGLLSGARNYSIAVREDRGRITFLRTVVPGATDRSYGVQVARLAGVPEAVTARAEEILRQIEREAVIEPLSRSRRTRRVPRYTQLIFFDDSQPAQDPVLEAILGLDIDSLTPRDALNRLAEYQRILRERDGTDQAPG